jgi:membrane protein implicated in regulation of membrane protease activity
MDEREISGYIMAIAGFVMILINALSYLLGWAWKSPAFTILGLVLIVIGAKTARKTSWVWDKQSK